jgi:predicted 2-oxoglutarate/Fe(II)-dependent dioxygenase YbiX
MANPLQRILPHLVCRDFLPRREREALLDWAFEHEALFGPSGLGREHKRDTAIRNALHVREAVARPWTGRLRDYIRAALPAWWEPLGIAPFEVSSIELDLIAYNDGAYYRRHTDTERRRGGDEDASDPRWPGDRMITAVYYFHAEPKGFDGGGLRLHPVVAPDAEMPQFADIAPEQNSVAVFPSYCPHEVLPVRCPSGAFRDSRFAINCWVRRARPDQ